MRTPMRADSCQILHAAFNHQIDHLKNQTNHLKNQIDYLKQIFTLSSLNLGNATQTNVSAKPRFKQCFQKRAQFVIPGC